jgi:hypothetical protein
VRRSVLKGDSDHAIRVLVNPAVVGSKRKQLPGAEFGRQLFEVIRPELPQFLTKLLIRQLFTSETLES